jgi:hypothetical protein
MISYEYVNPYPKDLISIDDPEFYKKLYRLSDPLELFTMYITPFLYDDLCMFDEPS